MDKEESLFVTSSEKTGEDLLCSKYLAVSNNKNICYIILNTVRIPKLLN